MLTLKTQVLCESPNNPGERASQALSVAEVVNGMSIEGRFVRSRSNQQSSERLAKNFDGFGYTR